ncbi:LysE family transporter [Metaclostridioides mangenotii]|uniref:LysE family transporter n=1 Tax=Metaclostridioides mangenotii TaxID=1540 RepID=UPI000486A08B|nr:LysE family transporter [Clostridioides mangenotii]
MNYSVWVSFLSYTVITALSPGPNNILALNATGSAGIKKSKNILLGIYTGFTCIMVICGIFSSALLIFLPNIMNYMKYIGAVYIFWLAYHVAFSKPIETNSQADCQSFSKGFILQFANVKIILWGITAFTGFIMPYYQSPLVICAFVMILSLIGNGATHIWAVAGSMLGSFLRKYWKISNICMSILLLYSAIHLVLE